MLEIEVVDVENEVLDNENGVTINEDDLPPERKGYYSRNPPNIK